MCSKNIVDVIEGETIKKPPLIHKSSSSLKKDLKEYYRSPKRRGRVIIANRNHFFNDNDTEKNIIDNII